MENEESTPELSKEQRIEAHFTTDHDYTNEIAFEVYTKAVKSGLFEDMEVPLDAFSYSTTLLWNGRKSPLSVIKALMDLFDEHTDPVFTDEHKRFMLERLVNYYRLTHYTNEDGKTYQLPKIEKLLRAELDKLPKSDEEEPKKFDWPTTKKHLTTLPDTPTKIAHLLEQQANYKQTQAGQFDWGLGPKFDKQCQMEIKKLRDLAELEQPAKSPFKLSEKKGAKFSLIRISNALYELNLIELENGQRPTKEQFMQQIGGFLGVDMKHYEQTLSKALEQPLEANLAVFEELKQVIQMQVLARLEKGRK